ncbi:MAG: hypothetical protein E6K81_04410 [Candidatus Eisenbacteria bacterium]|uniref:DUF5916 domain-containing protein n=1 Tax=Eiseniibacteriota bacterium TaxID=2212470 RepID=A0A538UC70_UNCEI|nr:MAG: hypothetical protein E6K81_04410 [Candidatus Eisenbacteria bacterium]
MTSQPSRPRAQARPRCGAPAPWTRVYLAAACLALGSAPALATPPAPAPGAHASGAFIGPPAPASGAFIGPPARASGALTRPPIRAVRLTGDITIDGALTEPVWQCDNACTAMVERIPIEGVPAAQRTEVRVAYDDHAIYIGARMYDTAPDSIVARLGRRDDSVASDEFAVYLDPYHDRRSGYFFVINAAGALSDGTLSNDVSSDKSWDGVWEGRARIDAQGWTAEMKIPCAQLRFDRAGEFVWGIDFRRTVTRRREEDWIVYRPRKESGFVSRFPDLVGEDRIAAARPLEVWPYLTAKGEYLQHAPLDPFNHGSRLRRNGGADLHAGLGSRMSLNATFNPDFGQVEVDPDAVNLTDVETFLEEKRPFFVDGASMFEFGQQGAGDYWNYRWEDPLFFYGRRIGREPEAEVPDADYQDVPAAARILAAAKLSGNLSPTWSLGTLHAVTDRVMARLATGDSSWRAEVEPATYYGALRTQRVTSDRRVGIGFLGTSTVRSRDGVGLRDQLNDAAFLGGLDGWWFLDRSRTWVLSGWSAATRVQGDRQRMIGVQQSSAHYFQRPDAGYLGVDSTATSLTGFGHRYSLNKQKGATQFNAAVGWLTPRFEVNDLGYQPQADLVNAHIGSGYRWTRPGAVRRYQTVRLALFGAWDNGGDALTRGAQASGYTELNNGYSMNYYVSGTLRGLNNRRTQGGPLTLQPASWSLGADLGTDPQRALFYYAGFAASHSQSGSWSIEAYPAIEWKPSAAFSLKFSPFWERLRDDTQFLEMKDDTTATGTFGRRYLFAALDEVTVSAKFRINWTFTPRLSLQSYIQPFMSSAGYRNFRSLARARSYDFTPFDYGPGPDFTERSVKGDAVLRWEWRPGSALFLVWTQQRSESLPVGGSGFHPDFQRLAGLHPDNVYLVKLSYYFTP